MADYKYYKLFFNAANPSKTTEFSSFMVDLSIHTASKMVLTDGSTTTFNGEGGKDPLEGHWVN